MLRAALAFATLRNVEDCSTAFLNLLRNFLLHSQLRRGVSHTLFLPQLALQWYCKLLEKLPNITGHLGGYETLAFIFVEENLIYTPLLKTS